MSAYKGPKLVQWEWRLVLRGKEQTENNQPTPEDVTLPPPHKNASSFRLLVSDYAPPLLFLKAVIYLCHLPLQVLPSSKQLPGACGWPFWQSSPMFCKHVSVPYFPTPSLLLIIALHLAKAGAAFASTEQTGYCWDPNFLSFPFPNMPASILPSYFGFKEQVLSPVQSSLSVLLPDPFLSLSGLGFPSYVLFLCAITFFTDHILARVPLIQENKKKGNEYVLPLIPGSPLVAILLLFLARASQQASHPPLLSHTPSYQLTLGSLS